ncbi:unnamed protein product, partial [Ectocarpus sp. 12 AP-2014]
DAFPSWRRTKALVCAADAKARAWAKGHVGRRRPRCCYSRLFSPPAAPRTRSPGAVVRPGHGGGRHGEERSPGGVFRRVDPGRPREAGILEQSRRAAAAASA